jgi:quinol monooxygenase YgiN
VTGFVQVIQIRTSRVQEIRRLVAEMRAENEPGAVRGTVTADRDRPGYYFNIVEFDSYEAAMQNSTRPDVSAYAARLAALCDEPPRFYNLDVLEVWGAADGQSSKADKDSGRATIAGKAVGAASVAAASVATGVSAGVSKAREMMREQR